MSTIRPAGKAPAGAATRERRFPPVARASALAGVAAAAVGIAASNAGMVATSLPDRERRHARRRGSVRRRRPGHCRRRGLERCRRRVEAPGCHSAAAPPPPDLAATAGATAGGRRVSTGLERSGASAAHTR
jgi:hypothetical protein